MSDGQAAALAPERVRRVLIIDDEDSVLLYMSLMIKRIGFEVVTCTTIRPELLVQFGPSDLIFIDMQMPGMDGIQAIELLSRLGVTSPVVLMSGSHPEILETAERIAKRHGIRIAGVLKKPFRQPDLHRILTETPRELKSQSGHRPQPRKISTEDLVKGLELREFDAFLQPIINLGTRKAIGFEALARWRSKKFNLLDPDGFIGLAAQNGLLPQLTQQLADKALAYSAALKARGLPWRVSLNLGVEDFIDPALPEKLGVLVMKHGLPTGSLTVELTESSATQDETRMLEILARFRLKEIDLAIDDFGTAFSSLERLSLVPFTSLKIDKQFIAGIVSSKNALIIVDSAIVLAKRLKLSTVAEGIETEAQLEILKGLGCDHGQGWLFAPAMEFKDTVDWIVRNEHGVSL